MAQTQEHQTDREHAEWKARFLDAQAERGRERKQRLYALMHVQAGHRALDVGPGPGTDTIPLARLVGPTGQVVGLDTDEAMVVEANKRAEEAGVSGWVEHKVGDASAMPFEDDYFDACHAERVFMHLVNPEQVSAEMVRETKPAGCIAIVDVDWATLSIDTPMTDVERRIASFYAKVHKNPYAGRQLNRFFKQHGLVDISIDVEPFVGTDLVSVDYFLRLEERGQKALEAGVVTQDEFERFWSSLEQADAMGAFFCMGNQVTTIGRKP